MGQEMGGGVSIYWRMRSMRESVKAKAVLVSSQSYRYIHRREVCIQAYISPEDDCNKGVLRHPGRGAAPLLLIPSVLLVTLTALALSGAGAEDRTQTEALWEFTLVF